MPRNFLRKCWGWQSDYDLDFFLGIFAPDFRASLNAMATACLRLFTFFLPPDFSVPCLNSCITFSVLPRPLLADDERFLEVVFLAMDSSLARLPFKVKCFRNRHEKSLRQSN